MYIFIVLLLGWISGYLVNYIADVLPENRKPGRPVCRHCGSAFAWSDYLLLRACRTCGHPRPIRFAIVQALMLAGAAYILWVPPQRIGFGLGFLTLVYFAVVTVIDLEYRLILHVVSAAGAVLGLACGIVAHGLVSTLVGGAVGLAVMFGFYLLGSLFARYRAKKLAVEDDEEALGFGDVTLGGVLGLFLGWPLIWFGLLLGILIGGLASLLIMIGLMVTRRYQALNAFTAYGPFLISGTVLLIYFPQQISRFLPK